MRWDFLISTQQNLFVIFGAPKELCSNGERKNDGALISIHRNPLAKSLLTIGILERAKRNWNARRLLERPKRSGTPEGLLERAKRNWNARRATGTREAPMERPKGYWNTAQHHTLTLKCVNFVNFVNFWKIPTKHPIIPISFP